jgi:hypothetical protein
MNQLKVKTNTQQEFLIGMQVPEQFVKLTKELKYGEGGTADWCQ